VARSEDRFEVGNRSADASCDHAKGVAGSRLGRPEDDGNARAVETMFDKTAGDDEGAEVVVWALGEAEDAVGAATRRAAELAAGVDEKAVGDADAEVPLVGRVGAGEEMLRREKSGIPVVGEEIEGVLGELVGGSEVVLDDERATGFDRPGRVEMDAGRADIFAAGLRSDGVAVHLDGEVAAVEIGFGGEDSFEEIEWGVADVFQVIGGADVESLSRGGDEADFDFFFLDLVAGRERGVAGGEGE